MKECANHMHHMWLHHRSTATSILTIFQLSTTSVQFKQVSHECHYEMATYFLQFWLPASRFLPLSVFFVRHRQPSIQDSWKAGTGTPKSKFNSTSATEQEQAGRCHSPNTRERADEMVTLDDDVHGTRRYN